jgi:alcohol sulfotransferase
MLSRFYQRRYGLPEGTFLEYDNLSRRAPGIPTLFFTHGNYLRDFTGHFDSVAEDFRDQPVLLLVRDPRDIAVSQYFQWKHRMSSYKKWLNRYPAEDSELSVWQFVAEHEAGLDRAIRFLNVWADAASRLEAIEIIRYEDMRTDPEASLHRVLRFLGADPDEAGVSDAVEYARFDNMRRLEEEMKVSASGRRLVPGKRGKSDSYKVRRAKVGGWRDYFDEEQIAALDARVRSELRPGFGYGPADDRFVGGDPESGDQTKERRFSA